jgi:AcrR family transcriptional regulator
MAGATSRARPRSLREENAAETRELLLTTALTIIERGEEPTMRAIAHEARVGERTVYRYFETRDALHLALVPKLSGRMGVPLCETYAELTTYATDLYRAFETNRQLNITMLTASWAQPAFTRSRKKNLADMRRLVDAAFPAAPADARSAATSVLRNHLSGSGWMYLRVSCALSMNELMAHTRWLIRSCAVLLGGTRS